MALWVIMSGMAILANEIEVNNHPDQARAILSPIGTSLWCVPFGVAGLLLATPTSP